MRYYLIAGEASGDLHGSNLMLQLQATDPRAEFRFWGGDKMKEVGGIMTEHYRNTAFMGFWEVIKNLKKIAGYFNKCKADIKESKPDVIILIDYPGFNIRIARWAKKEKFKVVYYITPQVWAWHKSRVHSLGRFTDKLLVILPFEKAFFAKFGYTATYVGHPLLDAIDKFVPDPRFREHHKLYGDIIALLPGSRYQEIKMILPEMLRAVADSKMTIVIGGAPSITDVTYNNIIEAEKLQHKVILIRNQTYDILSVAKMALVGSGTATLETALFKVPQIVCYKGSKLSYLIAKRLVDVQYISLVNLIAGKEVVKELIQDSLTASNIILQLSQLTKDREKIIFEYNRLAATLGSAGASENAAREIIKLLHT